jgi:hypothetical protein
MGKYLPPAARHPSFSLILSSRRPHPSLDFSPARRVPISIARAPPACKLPSSHGAPARTTPGWISLVLAPPQPSSSHLSLTSSSPCHGCWRPLLAMAAESVPQLGLQCPLPWLPIARLLTGSRPIFLAMELASASLGSFCRDQLWSLFPSPLLGTLQRRAEFPACPYAHPAPCAAAFPAPLPWLPSSSLRL